MLKLLCGMYPFIQIAPLPPVPRACPKSNELVTSIFANPLKWRCATLLIFSKKAGLPYKAETQSNKLPELLGAVMIEVIIADDQELSCIGMAEVLAVVDDVRIVGQARSPEQLLSTLKNVSPHVLILSTNFLPAFSKIQRILKRRQTALLVLAEDNDRAAYMRWLEAQGILDRSMDGSVIVDAMRRVARGELFVRKSSSDMRKDPSKVA